VVVTTNFPPTKIGEESTVPSSATLRRVSFPTFCAVIAVLGELLWRAASKPNTGQSFETVLVAVERAAAGRKASAPTSARSAHLTAR
jgi:hypothetical protein